jgi:transposase
MTTNPQDPTPPTKSQRPRWRRKRYWILGVVVLLLLAMSPKFGVWYRRHQMIQHLCGGYGKKNRGANFPQYFLAQEAWPRKYLDWTNITPFDRLATADLEPMQSSDLKWIAGETRLSELVIFYPLSSGGDDSGFDALAGLDSLESLTIREVSLRGNGLKHLRGLQMLSFLELGLWDASPGLVELRGHPSIQSLSFRESKNFVDGPEARIELSKIMTAAVSATRDMPRLRYLSFVGAADSRLCPKSGNVLQIGRQRDRRDSSLVFIREDEMARHGLSEEQWETVRAVLPPVARLGRKPVDRRLILEGILYVLKTGCPWRDLPAEFGNWSTFYERFRLWSHSGVWQQILQALQARAHANGRIEWDLFLIDGSNVRAHKAAAGASKQKWPMSPQTTL